MIDRPIRWPAVWLGLLLAVALPCSMAWTGGHDPLAERRAKVEALSPAEKEELLEHVKRFSSLSPAEQERVRLLNEQLEQDEHGAALRRVLQRYYAWLKTLPPYEQAELADLPPHERVAKIKKLLEDQAQRYAKRPRPDFRHSRFNPKDMEILLEWVAQYASRQGPKFLEKLNPDRRKELDRVTNPSTADPLRRNEILSVTWLRWQVEHPGKGPPVTEEDLADLRSRLSPDLRKLLESKPTAEQWNIVSGMIRGYVFRQYAARRAEAQLPLVSDEELAAFFEKELKPAERDRLVKLSGEEFQRELWRMYMRWKLPNLTPPGPGDGREKPPPGRGWDKGRDDRQDSRRKPEPPEKKPAESKPSPPPRDAHGDGY